MGQRLRTHSVDGATASQESLLELERDELGRRGAEFDALAAADQTSHAIVIAALAHPYDDRPHARLVAGIANINPVEAADFYNERWRVGRHVALLRNAIVEGLPPVVRRERLRRLEHAS